MNNATKIFCIASALLTSFYYAIANVTVFAFVFCFFANSVFADPVQTYSKGVSRFTDEFGMTLSEDGENTTLTLTGGTLTFSINDVFPNYTGLAARFDASNQNSVVVDNGSVTE